MIRPSLLLALCVTTVIGVAAVASPAAEGWTRSCGSLLEYYRDQGGREAIRASEITGRNLSCSGARGVARAYASRSHYSRTNRNGERRVRNKFPRAVGSFRCAYEYLGSDIRNVACREGNRSVAFVWYDSSGYH